ncbi:exodeoxyribonuclease VII small subunit [Bacteroides sp. 519]|uniref:exodeoxyribonuclease VII small subunit n=1 Tax=Bacteroides sp. 519 TaxID=2302937 RepID=UPI0013D55DC5|nr:exodeoxyribonuclease VII small subunit [Bacteroides sp. 519]NDV58703.1 exodeoxyribonuclease VII small subunit [Bacteroides sp. 519]
MDIENLTYKQAMTLLDEIIFNVENNKYEIDEIDKKLKEAQQLIDHCNEILEAIGKFRKGMEE